MRKLTYFCKNIITNHTVILASMSLFKLMIGGQNGMKNIKMNISFSQQTAHPSRGWRRKPEPTDLIKKSSATLVA
jgi:hypothetical protein